jgi:pyruvate dehydrogenase E2 component (dihydrolipoamide acetyltransferase)
MTILRFGVTDTQDLAVCRKPPQLNYNTLLPQVTQFDLLFYTDRDGKPRGELKA